MSWIFTLLLFFSLAHAETSKVIPVFLNAVEVYQNPNLNPLFLKPEIRSVVEVLKNKNISPELLEPFLLAKKDHLLPADDKYDQWIKTAHLKKQMTEPMEVSLHANKIDVVISTQYSDDVYAYFFITDGVIPTGKVTSIYKGVASGEGFFFNPVDRSIFPLIGIPAKAPSNHLIVDYGIVESDGDDIKKLQQLSSIIIDIAIAVYAGQSPNGQVLMNLRKEIKALADLLISFNSDDRLVTNSFGYTTEEISKLLSERSFVDFKKIHKHETDFTIWQYDIHFRLLR
jgi:hypothetical protein